jgi:hypothetical protein
MEFGVGFADMETKPAQKPSGPRKKKEEIMFHNRLL